MAVESTHHSLQHVGLSLLTAVSHRPLGRVPASDRIVAVHDLAGNAERLAPVDDVFFGVQALGRRGNAPVVVHDEYQHRQLVAWPRAPDQARSEVALVGASIAADYDRDTVAAVPLLHPGSA